MKLSYWERFTLGAGCWANPVDCWTIHSELDRIREKVDAGEPITPAEAQWVQSGSSELEETAKQVTQDVIYRPAQSVGKSVSSNIIWPLALAIGVALAIR